MNDRWDDDQWNLESDDSDDALMPCPGCRREIYDDSPFCPYCGEYVTETSRSFWASKPGWLRWMGVIVAVVLILALVLFQVGYL